MSDFSEKKGNHLQKKDKRLSSHFTFMSLASLGMTLGRTHQLVTDLDLKYHTF